jgi:uncharacterized protein YgbK (DUF1537 family)
MACLGCIADDLTGATDLANNLVRAGMRVVQTIGVPGQSALMDVDAIVVALKSRTIPAAEAVVQSLEACRWLRKQDARQIYFKICSTFDSSPQGNIGPVIEALMDELDCNFSIATPAFPENGRTVFNGHLFVGHLLLSDTGMRNHPLTPMTDANLVRALQAQLSPARGRKVGLIDFRTVAQSPNAIRESIGQLRPDEISIAIADATTDQDLLRLAAALCDAPLVTAASGLAIGLPANWGFSPSLRSSQLPPAAGRKAIVAGSCSMATTTQVKSFICSGGHALELTPIELAANPEAPVANALAWAEACWVNEPSLPLLVYSTAEPAAVKSAQQKLGVHQAGALVEHALSAVARGLVERGAGQLILAGGETAGACIHALGVRQLQIGPQIDPGVPWCHAASPLTESGLHLALKSGNFGSPDFFTQAFTVIA